MNLEVITEIMVNCMKIKSNFLVLFNTSLHLRTSHIRSKNINYMRLDKDL